MNDQSFSEKNFRKLFDEELKKQGDIARIYFPYVLFLHKKKKWLVKQLRRYLKLYKNNRISEETRDKKIALIQNALLRRKCKIDSILSEDLSEISRTINRKGYRLPLELSSYTVKGKQVYNIGASIESIFTSLNLIRILKNVYAVKSANRNLVISRLKTILDDKSKKVIIRVDIESFYESIQHDILLDIIHSDTKLSVPPKRIITQLIRDYSILTNSSKGLPRGIGISAYLSELFMHSVDTCAQSMTDIIYYARYVDDMVFVFAPTNISNACDNYLNTIKTYINDKGLNLNTKTQIIDTFSPSGVKNFDYLGYRFQFQGSKLQVHLTRNKIKKYKEKIEKAFIDYNKKSRLTPNAATKLLILRMRFLTGNTRLHNSKKNAYIGTYSSNNAVSSYESFRTIDQYYLYQISTLSDPKLSRKLSKFSFESGAKEKIFRNFTPKQLKDITEIWNYA